MVMDKPIIIETKKYEDFRGWLSVSAEDFHVVQINQGYSRKKFTLRGLHYQEGEHSQAKLVSCLHGSIFNVAVDLRSGKTTVMRMAKCCHLKTRNRCTFREDSLMVT